MTMARFWNIVGIACFAAMMLLSFAIVAGFFSRFHPALDSIAHFRAHFAVLMILAALPLLATTFRTQALAAITFGVATLYTVSAYVALPGTGPANAAMAQDGPVYRLMQMNVRFDNKQPEKVLSLIGRVQPDVITLEEVSAMWAGKLEPLFARYPHHVLCPFPNGVFGVAILSRRPFAAGTEPRCYDGGAMAVASVDFGGNTADITAFHLGWPWPYGQSRQIDRLAPALGTLGLTALLGGDFNATPWSAAVARVASEGKLTTERSPGATWLEFELPDFLHFAGLPIDQVMSKGNVTIHSVTLGEDAGSDHRPLLVNFSFPASEGIPDEETATVSHEAAILPNG